MSQHDSRYPAPAPGVFRASQSSIETYLRCGERWRFEQEERHRRSTVAMAIGTAVSKAAECDNLEKKHTGTGWRLAELVERGVAEYERVVESEEVPAASFEISRGKDATADASRAYGELVSPRISDVRHAEERMSAIIDSVGGEVIELVGTPDCIEPDIVRDTKTGQPWSQDKADESRQLSGYSLLYEAKYGALPRRVAIDSIYKTRRGWEATTLFSVRGEREVTAFVRAVRRARDGIKAGIALPAAESSWWCAKNWCPFWGQCSLRPGA